MYEFSEFYTTIGHIYYKKIPMKIWKRNKDFFKNCFRDNLKKSCYNEERSFKLYKENHYENLENCFEFDFRRIHGTNYDDLKRKIEYLVLESPEFKFKVDENFDFFNNNYRLLYNQDESFDKTAKKNEKYMYVVFACFGICYDKRKSYQNRNDVKFYKKKINFWIDFKRFNKYPSMHENFAFNDKEYVTKKYFRKKFFEENSLNEIEEKKMFKICVLLCER